MATSRLGMVAVSSESRRAKRSYSITLAALLWNSAISAAHEALNKHGAQHIKIVRHEDLVANPDETFRAITNWLELPPFAAVPLPAVINSSYTPDDGPVHFSQASVERWRSSLSAAECAHVERITDRKLRIFNYDAQRMPISVRFSAIELLCFPFRCAVAALANRSRIPNMPRYIYKRLSGLFRRY